MNKEKYDLIYKRTYNISKEADIKKEVSKLKGFIKNPRVFVDLTFINNIE